MKLMEFLNFSLINRFIFLVGIAGYNILDNEHLNFFNLAFYILCVSIMFLLEFIFYNKKVGKYIRFINIAFSLVFILSDLRLTSCVAFVLVVENLKNKLWSNFMFLLLAFVLIIINYKGNDYFYCVYFSIFYLINFRVIRSFNKRIIKLEMLEFKFRKKYLESNKMRESIYQINRQNIKLVRLEERNEIGRKMHDKIGHIIAASIMRLEAAIIIMKNDKEKAECMIEDVAETLRVGMDDIREIIHKITPSKEEMGINKIKKILTDKLIGSTIGLEFSFVGDMSEISYDYWNKIEQFVMELSTNALKYSKCQKIYFRIDVLNKIIKMQFKDDGIGVKKLKKGYGISKIEEDLVSCGKVLIDTSNGFDVIILFNK